MGLLILHPTFDLLKDVYSCFYIFDFYSRFRSDLLKKEVVLKTNRIIKDKAFLRRLKKDEDIKSLMEMANNGAKIRTSRVTGFDKVHCVEKSYGLQDVLLKRHPIFEWVPRKDNLYEDSKLCEERTGVKGIIYIFREGENGDNTWTHGFGEVHLYRNGMWAYSTILNHTHLWRRNGKTKLYTDGPKKMAADLASFVRKNRKLLWAYWKRKGGDRDSVYEKFKRPDLTKKVPHENCMSGRVREYL